MYSEDLRFANYAENTVKNYCAQVELFLKHFNNKVTKPSEINENDIKKWLMLSNSINSLKHRISALKLFYKLTGKQPLKLKCIKYPRSERHLPQVIESGYILKKIERIQNIKHKAIIMLAFSVGLRVSEVINLKISDIDSRRMIITIRQAKGRKDRIVPLSKNVLDCLREYYKAQKPKNYLFNGQFSEKYTTTSCNAIIKQYLGKKYHFHQLRHSCFTSLIENGTDLRIIQKLAGHSSSKTTEIYTHISTNLLQKIALPV